MTLKGKRNHYNIKVLTGYGISLILLNVGIYFVAPATVIIRIKKKL